jgi:hypothetical protein
MKAGKPVHRSELLADSDYAIIMQFQAEYRGYVQYYACAQNVAWLGKLHWIMETALLKTLACKHKTSVATLSKKYRSTQPHRTGHELPQGSGGTGGQKAAGRDLAAFRWCGTKRSQSGRPALHLSYTPAANCCNGY